MQSGTQISNQRKIYLCSSSTSDHICRLLAARRRMEIRGPWLQYVATDHMPRKTSSVEANQIKSWEDPTFLGFSVPAKSDSASSVMELVLFKDLHLVVHAERPRAATLPRSSGLSLRSVLVGFGKASRPAFSCLPYQQARPLLVQSHSSLPLPRSPASPVNSSQTGSCTGLPPGTSNGHHYPPTPSCRVHVPPRAPSRRVATLGNKQVKMARTSQ